MLKRKNNQEFFPFGEMIVVNLANDFKKLLTNFGDNQSKINELSSVVISKYSEKHRYCHNLSHVDALLSAAENFKDKFTDYESVQLGIWLHDVIYQPKRFDNETESAKLAVKNLRELNLPKIMIEKVEKIILATQKHDEANLDFDGKLFLDLDLGILGTDEKVYQNYKSAIRREYSFVPCVFYRRSRAKILANFLNRATIYFTNELCDNFRNKSAPKYRKRN